jgi:hypothetical protein
MTTPDFVEAMENVLWVFGDNATQETRRHELEHLRAALPQARAAAEVVEAAVAYIGYDVEGGFQRLSDPNLIHFGRLLDAIADAGYEVDDHIEHCELCADLKRAEQS